MNFSVGMACFLATVIGPIPDQGSGGKQTTSGLRAPTLARELTAEEQTLLRNASAEFAMGNFAACLKLFENLDGTSASHPELLNLRGSILTETGRVREAVPYFEWAAEASPESFWPKFNLAECALMLGDLDRASELFLKVPTKSPGERELVLLKLVLLDIRRGNLDSAKKHLPDWPPVGAAGSAAYAAVAQAEGREENRVAILEESKRLHGAEWGLFLKKTLEESGIKSE